MDVMEIKRILEENRLKSETFILKNYENVHFLIYSLFNDTSLSWREMTYLYSKDMFTVPNCYCGNKLTFLSYSKGYTTFCSKKCASNSADIKNKRKMTSIERYGVENPMMFNDIKNLHKKSINDKYGVDFISQIDSVKDKKIENNLIKHGVEYNSQRDDIKKILRNSLNGRRDSINLSNRIEIDNYLNHKISNLGMSYISSSGSNYTIKCQNEHEFDIHKNMLNDRLSNKNVICTVCNPIDSSSDSENNLFLFISNGYDGLILRNDRTTIGKELDIYLPDLNLAFEYNGVFWHSDNFKENNYHIDKTDMCEKLGIKLIHIWEDDWLFKNDIVKSRILNLLNCSNKIWARRCKILLVSNNDSRKFLNENHIQGYSISKINIGLFHNSELVSIMTFGGLRKSLGQNSKEGYWELLRFCNKKNTSVVGGASRLFKFFITNYCPISIISYADRCWSNGNLYRRLGFSFVKKTKPNYYYVVDGIRRNRFSYRKDILVKRGYDKSLSESKIMKSLGYNKIYDSGSLKYEFKIS